MTSLDSRRPSRVDTGHPAAVRGRTDVPRRAASDTAPDRAAQSDTAACPGRPGPAARVGRVVSTAGTVVAPADLHRAAHEVLTVICATAGRDDALSIGAAVRGGRTGPADAIATTDDTAGSLHVVQHAAAQGPAITALADLDDLPVVVDDLPTDPRWPALGALLAEVGTGIRSVYSAAVELPQGHRGIITLSCPRAAAFADPAALARAHGVAVATGLGLAALLHRRRAENLNQALESNRQIGAAVGVLMSRHRWTYQDAFARLRDLSQHTHRKLRDLADDVLLVGDLPERDPSAGVAVAS